MHDFAEELLREIATIGRDPKGGITRLGLSPEEVSDMIQVFWDNGGKKQ